MTTKKTTKKAPKTKAQRDASRERMNAKIDKNRRETVDQLIAMMEKGGLSWVKEWSLTRGGYDVDLFDPWNPTSGTHYSGGNRTSLAMHCFMAGVNDNRFCTMNQANKRGWTVRKGSTPYLIEKWGQCPVYKKDSDGKVVRDADGKPEVDHFYLRLMSYYLVFNFSDIDGAPEIGKVYEPTTPEETDEATGKVLDALKETSRCEIRERPSNEAYYSPTLDYINVPNREEFTTPQAALRTMLHEMTHSTGHPTALDRSMGGRFGSSDYAYEELIAELGSVFVASYLSEGIAPEDDDKHKKNHAAYLQSWLKKLHDDPDYLYKAAAQASKASDYIIDRLVKVHPEYKRADPEIIPEAEADEEAAA